MTLMGLCGEVRSVCARELLDYTNYVGDYENEMGIGFPPEHRCLLETPEILIVAWGATVPMIAHAAGVKLDEITTTWEKWVTDAPIETAKGTVAAGHGCGGPVHDQRDGRGRAPHLARTREPGRGAVGARLAARKPGRRVPGRDRRKPLDHTGDRVPLHRRVRSRRGGCRLPRHGPEGPQRDPRGERAARRLGHHARPSPRRRRGDNPLTVPQAPRTLMPGGGVARRPLHFIVMADQSGGMAGEKMQALNFAIADMLSYLAEWERDQLRAQVLVRVLGFATECEWHVKEPSPVSDVDFKPLQAVHHGWTNMGPAFQGRRRCDPTREAREQGVEPCDPSRDRRAPDRRTG